jgi:aryl-alcohol dehydrogenase
MRIRAAVLRDVDEPFDLGEVLVRLVATGICHTDLSMREDFRSAPLPVVLGHEGFGVVEATAEGVTDVEVGQHVVISFAWCGTCVACRRGQPAYCDLAYPLNFDCRRADGTRSLTDARGPIYSHFFGQSSFASHCVVQSRQLVPVDPDVDPTVAAPLGCGVQTGAGSVFNVFDPEPDSTLAVVGCGSVGLAAVMAGKVSGCRTIVGIDLVESRRDLATRLGATHTGADLGVILDASEGRGVDYVLDTTGVAEVMEQGIGMLAPQAVYGFVAAGAVSRKVSIAARQLMLGRSLTGIIQGASVPRQMVPRLLDLHSRGLFPLEELVTMFPFDEIDAAEAASHSGQVVKPVLLHS